MQLKATPTPAGVDVLVETMSDLFRTYRHQATRLYAEWGVPAHATPILGVLDRHGDLRLTDLACALSVDPSVISRQSADLVRDGLLERRADPADGRASLLRLTEEGHVVLDRLREKRLLWLGSAMSSWTDTDVATLSTLLGRLSAVALGAGTPTSKGSA